MERVTMDNWLTCDADAFICHMAARGWAPLPDDWLTAKQTDAPPGDGDDERAPTGWQQASNAAKRGRAA